MRWTEAKKKEDPKIDTHWRDDKQFYLSGFKKEVTQMCR